MRNGTDVKVAEYRRFSVGRSSIVECESGKASLTTINGLHTHAELVELRDLLDGYLAAVPEPDEKAEGAA